MVNSFLLKNQAKNQLRKIGKIETQDDFFFYFINNLSLQNLSTPNKRGFWNLRRPRNHKILVGKGKYFENIIQNNLAGICTWAVYNAYRICTHTV